MSAIEREKSKLSKIWGFVSRAFVAFCCIYFYPEVKQALFPSQMTRIEKMLRGSTMDGYSLAVDRQSEYSIILTVYNGGKSIATEIDRDAIRELEPVDDGRIFFTHTIRKNAVQKYYLARTRMETDADLKRLLRLEVTVCDPIKSQTGKVTYDGHEPVYECEVPVLKAVCSAVE